jgi:tetratricopeptide (TPR) repeat protein
VKVETKTDPALCTQLHARGVTLMKAGNYKEAKSVLTQASAANPADYECEFDLAVTLLELGDFHPAVIKFEDVSSNTQNAKAMMYCGHCHARAGELEAARDCYRAAMARGKDAVKWEYNWQMAYASLISKDWEDALSKLESARAQAQAAKIKDYRLERDLAIALHGCKRDKEALEHLNALSDLGYTPEAQLLADVKKGAEVAPNQEPKPAPTEVAQVQPAKPDEPKVEKPVDPKPVQKPIEKKDPPAEPKVTQVTPPTPPITPATQPKEIAVTPPPVTPKNVTPPADTKTVTPPKAQETPKVATDPATQSTTTEAKPIPVVSKNVKRAETRPAHPKRPLPPIPTDFDEALAAGKRAFEEGETNWKLNTKDAKIKAEQCYDEAEAMYRGAWTQKPGDEKVVAALKELAKHHGAIALVKNTYVKTKANGLVVLDCSPSIAPEETLYCAWEQSDGDPLGLRPEQLIPNAQKTVSFKIRTPGTYKFDLAVSDGVRGGNPVTVTVEVGE